VNEQQVVLAAVEPALELELVDGTIADQLADPAVIAAPARSGSEQRNLFGEAERIAARAASASTRRQYASIFRAFGDWLGGELGRPARGRGSGHGRDRRLRAPPRERRRPRASCRAGHHARVSTMIRALAHDLGREDQVQGVRVPRHEPGPPETLTDTDYANLLRVADRRTLAGKRDYALL
jgi:hypothetical protein